MNEKKLLFVSSHLPSNQVPEAGQKIALERIRHYRAQGYRIYLLSFVNEMEYGYVIKNMFDDCEESLLVSVNDWKRLLSVIRNPFLPLRISSRIYSEAISYVRRLILENQFDLVHFEFTSVAWYGRYIPAGVPKVVVEHDVLYQLFGRKIKRAPFFMRPFLALETARMKHWELRMLAGMDNIIVLNRKDQALLISDHIAPDRIRVVEPEVNPVFRTVRRDRFGLKNMLFWGAMNRIENRDAVDWFLKSIFPKILLQHPDAKLFVVGANPPEHLQEIKNPNIVVTGFVEDPIPWFEKCAISVVPLRMGAGIKLKVLECIAAGMPVVTTQVGAEGIDSPGLTIAETETAFAHEVNRLLSGQK